ncbi:MAG: copper resistance protein NlpE [Porphyromonadaceae bacterium]|nr:copper resistance protein NlpE [Porphyromonadaceae bacterium]
MKQKILILFALLAVVFSSCKKEKTEDKSEERIEESDSIVISEESLKEHSAKNALDWAGEYKGIVPCEDCDGVETALILNEDLTFTQSLTYIGKGGPYDSNGSFTWDDMGNVVSLEFEDGSIAKYFVGENKLFLLDDYGNRLEGDDYVLRK